MANKKLKSIEVGLIGCGDAVTLNASDTATEPIATYALDKFKAEDQMSFKDDGKEYYVPFHAVDHIIVEESEVEVADRPNPYGCEAESGGGGKREAWLIGTHYAVSGTIEPNQTDITNGTTTKSFDEWINLLKNGNEYLVELDDCGTLHTLEYTDEKAFRFESSEGGLMTAAHIESEEVSEGVFEDMVDVGIDVADCESPTLYVTKK